MLDLIFLISISIILIQRIAELMLARRNARIVTSLGGYEAGKEHYKYIVLLHAFFFGGLLFEAALSGIQPPVWWMIPFILFTAAQIIRYWCIRSLGPFWNTRVFVVPGSLPVAKGPYRFLRHPNYLVVTVELLAIPLLFGLYVSAFIFPLLNIILIKKVRIPVEEEALGRATRYGKVMSSIPRLLPTRLFSKKP